MSKIDDALFEIKQYLAGNDHSDNPSIRQAAQVYSQACREINEKLSECRQLIARGLLIDARKLDAEIQPSLSERAEKLILAPSMFNHYQELCRLYGYPTAPDIDRSALSELNQTPGGKEEILKELILRWRKTARTGTNPDKMKLLRAIISNAPSDDQIWRTNLASVERQWISDLQKEADKAIRENTSEKLVQIYMALTDPQLLKPVPAASLKKLQPYVRKYQQQMLERDLEKKRNDLFSAYSSQNFDLISERMREYDMLITNPLYTADAEAEQAVAEVRSYLQEETARRNTERFHADKLAELIHLLDTHGDYTLIENIYVSLQKTDIPLDKRLTQRVMNRREEYILENSRKHTRKVIYSILGAMIILLLAAGTFHIVQSTRTFFSYQKSMQNLLANGNYPGVVKLHEEIKKKSPILLQFGNLTALRMEAEKAAAARNDLEQQVNNLLSSAEQQLKSRNPLLPELKNIQKSLQELDVKNLPSELADRQQKINFAIRRLEFDTQQKLDQEYIAHHQKCLAELAGCQAMLVNKDISLTTVQNRIIKTMNFMQELAVNSPKVTENIRKSRNALVQQQGKALLNELKNIDYRRQLLEALYMPKNFAQYCDALKKLPVDAPDLATGIWRNALNNIHATQSLAAGSGLTIYNSHAELEKVLHEQPVNISNNCFIRDITRLLPDKYFNIKFIDAVNQLRQDLSALYNCYELTFADGENVNWHFYSAEKPQVDKRRTSKIPKALAISVMLSPGMEGKFLPLLIEKKKDGKIIYKPGDFRELPLPETFIELKNVKITSSVFPKSRQFNVLEDVLRTLSRCKTPAQLPVLLTEAVNKVIHTENMNIFTRAYMLRRLLEIYALTSDFHRMATNAPGQELDDIAKNLYAKWYLPSIEAENPDAVKKLKLFFKKFSMDQLASTARTSSDLYRLALNRGLTPGGIVLKVGNNQQQLHWFSGMDVINELWFYTNGGKSNPSAVWIALDKNKHVDSKNKMLVNHNLNLPHGTVFFVPFDDRNTAELARKTKAAATADKVSVISWPETWPVNKR